MPFTYLGFNIAIPSILGLDAHDGKIMSECFYIAYFAHYLTIHPVVACLFLIMYYYPVSLSYVFRKTFIPYTRYGIICVGLGISITALLFQEIVGHYIGGDKASRPEGVFNAMLYAMFYSISHYLRE